MENLRELWAFMRVSKKYWLAPIVIFLLLLSLLIVLSGNAGFVSPIMYML